MLSMTRRRRPSHLVPALLLFALIPALATAPASAAPATAAHDYLRAKGLSQATYDYRTQVVHDTVLLPMADGEGVYLEITRPTTSCVIR